VEVRALKLMGIGCGAYLAVAFALSLVLVILSQATDQDTICGIDPTDPCNFAHVTLRNDTEHTIVVNGADLVTPVTLRAGRSGDLTMAVDPHVPNRFVVHISSRRLLGCLGFLLPGGSSGKRQLSQVLHPCSRHEIGK